MTKSEGFLLIVAAICIVGAIYSYASGQPNPRVTVCHDSAQAPEGIPATAACPGF
ncbi:exported hypothetical protein [Mesorhizobium plurifarium]|uniref:Uncharacterized protein n=1 Tax=Mesorhizobium plurifarium TaxID=69974 RepID=A0A0K2VVN3_MESPL|nr:exported hypothetical protein [Mesorhizobium plurifarium]